MPTVRNIHHDQDQQVDYRAGNTSHWIFQGCPLSVQLFNIVWNIALDMIESSSVKGYILKEVRIEKRQLSQCG